MARPRYTFLILRSDRERFRRVHLTARTVWAAAVAGIVLLGLLGGGAYAFVKSRAQDATLVELQATNEALRAERARVDATLSKVASRLNRFESRARVIADELGIEGLEVQEPAAGGPGPAFPSDAVDPELAALASRSVGLDRSLDTLDRVFRQRIELLAATPSAMPVQGWFSHGFGWRKDPWTGEREFHRGLDIVADQGTPVEAPADGVVSRTAHASDYGNVIDISHGHGYVTRYAHLSTIAVEPGQRVARGDVLGQVGTTGRSTGPHLHYEVFRDGRRVNPWKYLGRQ